MSAYLLAAFLFSILGYAIWKTVTHNSGDVWLVPDGTLPKEKRKFLMEEVSFYNSLTPQEKQRFEYKCLEFLQNVKITGVQTEVEQLDKILIAASAIIPIFAFPNWKYLNLKEVLLYPNSFNENFEIAGTDRHILGMVGTGYMADKMILSKQALRGGFASDDDMRNTAIHEFIHLLDKADGEVDGLPKVFKEKIYVLPWFDLIDKKIEYINTRHSEINPYGGTSRIEFFAVLGEYFFEMPELLKRKHPELYKHLVNIFDQDMAARKPLMKKVKIGRNDLCYCGSGEKFKRCCG